MPLRLAVDAERLVADYLRNQSDVAALVGARVYVARLPANPVFPLIVIHRVGGTPRWPQWLDQARLQIEAWSDIGPNLEEQARTVARTAQSALQTLPGRRALGSVSAVDMATGLIALPDLETARPRVLFDAIVYIHP